MKFVEPLIASLMYVAINIGFDYFWAELNSVFSYIVGGVIFFIGYIALIQLFKLIKRK